MTKIQIESEKFGLKITVSNTERKEGDKRRLKNSKRREKLKRKKEVKI